MPRPNKPSWHAANQCFRCRINGKPVYFPRSIGQFDRPLRDGVPKAAWDWLDEYKEELQSRVVSAVVEPTVFVLAQMHLQWVDEEHQAGRMSAANLRCRASHLATFWEWKHLDGRPIRDRIASTLEPEDLEAFADAMAKEKHSAHYVANLCASIHAMFNWGAKKVRGRTPVQFFPASPVKGFRPPKPPKVSGKYIESAKLRAFLKWAWKRARQSENTQRRFDILFVRMLWFLHLTGCRPGEACSARWDGIKWRDKVIVLEEWKNAKKTGLLREIHISPPVERLLRRIQFMRGRHPEYVFTHKLGRGMAGMGVSSEGMPWNSTALAQKLRTWRSAAARQWEEAKQAREMWDAAIAAGGQPGPMPAWVTDCMGEMPIVLEGAGRLHAYLLRHSYITDGLHAGLSESEIAEIAGTSADQVRQTYGHLQRKHLSGKVAKVLETIRGQAKGEDAKA